jgi:hypothetical protein
MPAKATLMATERRERRSWLIFIGLLISNSFLPNSRLPKSLLPNLIGPEVTSLARFTGIAARVSRASADQVSGSGGRSDVQLRSICGTAARKF